MNPKSEALAYRIWAFCEPRGWNVTISEVADALNEPTTTVHNIMRHRRWSSRIRVSPHTKGPFEGRFWRSPVYDPVVALADFQ